MRITTTEKGLHILEDDSGNELKDIKMTKIDINITKKGGVKSMIEFHQPYIDLKIDEIELKFDIDTYIKTLNKEEREQLVDKLER